VVVVPRIKPHYQITPPNNSMKTLLLLLCIGLLLACGGDPNPPDNVLPEDKMEKLLVDIHLLEARISKLNIVSVDSTTVLTENLKKKVFIKHQTDSSAYNRSYRFYSSYPSYFEPMYENVVKELEKQSKKGKVANL
jgi:Domain of unknown function (DUF4296)